VTHSWFGDNEWLTCLISRVSERDVVAGEGLAPKSQKSKKTSKTRKLPENKV
jgi:hypothetical protein